LHAQPWVPCWAASAVEPRRVVLLEPSPAAYFAQLNRIPSSVVSLTDASGKRAMSPLAGDNFNAESLPESPLDRDLQLI